MQNNRPPWQVTITYDTQKIWPIVFNIPYASTVRDLYRKWQARDERVAETIRVYRDGLDLEEQEYEPNSPLHAIWPLDGLLLMDAPGVGTVRVTLCPQPWQVSLKNEEDEMECDITFNVPFECTIDDLAAGWQTSVQYDIGDVYGWSEGLDGVERPVYADDRIVDLLSGGRSVLLQSQAGETEIVNVTMWLMSDSVDDMVRNTAAKYLPPLQPESIPSTSLISTSMSVLEVAAFRNSTLNEPNVDPEVSGALTGYCADTHDDDIDPDHCKMPTQTDTAEQPQGTPVLSNPTRAQRRTAKKEWEQTKAEALREKRRQKRIERNRHKMVPSQVIVAEPYDAANASVSSSGFMGKPFPRNSAKEIIQAWFSGSIYAMLVAFMLLPFSPTDPTGLYVVDCAMRLIFFRSTHFAFIQPFLSSIQEEAATFVEKCKPITETTFQKNTRGRHWFCIVGYDRNNKKEPRLSPFSRKNAGPIRHLFRKGGIFRTLSETASSLVEIHFPLIAERYRANARYMKRTHNIQPGFGLFWNFCLNAPRSNAGVNRVYCTPHVDSKNVAVGVCVVFVYGNFNHQESAWLVIWEAGIIVEIPPGVFVVYPSSLFYHFNIDIRDIQVVSCKKGVTPTPSNSTPIDGTDGRGSLVWFNQATMMQTSETGFATMKLAKAAGVNAFCDAETMIVDDGYFPYQDDTDTHFGV